MRILISLSKASSLSASTKVCPKCASNAISTERRINGNSMCRCGYEAPTKEFMRTVAQVDLEKNEPLHAAKDLPRAPYGYCPICNDVGVAREKRLNGNDLCIQKHSYPSASALPSPLGGFCQECRTPTNEDNLSDEYVNKHCHPKFSIPE